MTNSLCRPKRGPILRIQRTGFAGILDDAAQDQIRAPVLLLIILEFAFQCDLRLALRACKTALHFARERVTLLSRPQSVIEIKPHLVFTDELGERVLGSLRFFGRQFGAVGFPIQSGEPPHSLCTRRCLNGLVDTRGFIISIQARARRTANAYFTSLVSFVSGYLARKAFSAEIGASASSNRVQFHVFPDQEIDKSSSGLVSKDLWGASRNHKAKRISSTTLLVFR